MYVCMYVCMYVSMYICMYVCMYAAPFPTDTSMSRAAAQSGAPTMNGNTSRIDAARMTVHRSNRDHYENEPLTNNSNYAEFVSTVVQSRRDTNNPSSSRCEHSGNQANINSQMRLAKSLPHHLRKVSSNNNQSDKKLTAKIVDHCQSLRDLQDHKCLIVSTLRQKGPATTKHQTSSNRLQQANLQPRSRTTTRNYVDPHRRPTMF